jgi:SAM-dependent methyltransferase
MGYVVQGVDASASMIAVAQKRAQGLSDNSQVRVIFRHGDIRVLSLRTRFDAVISLFHVLSYQTSNADVRATFNTVSRHLSPGGICLLDFWYGPAVLHDPPAVRVKRLKDDHLEISRISEPTLCPNDNAVDVRFSFYARRIDANEFREFKECHRMRYFFLPELKDFLEEAELELRACREWITGKTPGIDTWSVFLLAQRKE